MSIKIALAGNPNCGKTTLFNALTGSNQFVGNWPGVTVEKKEGKLKGHKDVTIMDLPGIYSLSPYTLEEVVARNYLINERPDAIINIVDGTNIERNLYLSTQIMELGIPVVMAVNMMDLVKKNGDSINIKNLKEALGCEVVEISALKGTGIDEVKEKAIAAAKSKAANARVHSFDEAVEAAIESVSAKLDMEENRKRFFAIKLIEKDSKIIEQMKNAPDCSAEIKKLEDDFDDDTESIITSERYSYISSIIDKCVKKAAKGQKLTVSDKIDRVVTNRILALPIFVLIMWLVYYIAMSTVGAWCTDWTNDNLFGDGFHLFGIGSSAYEDASGDYDAATTALDAYGVLVTDDEDAVDVDATKAAIEANTNTEASVKYEMEDEETLDTYDIDVYYSEVPANANEDTTNAMSYLDAVDYFNETQMAEIDPADYGVFVPSIPDLISTGLDKIGCADWLHGLIIDGIVAGVGAVLGFVPQMLVLFILLAILEYCGYMARIAFIMDRIFRKFGLSGKSFIPVLVGTGCGVPGVMASRTIENERDRRMTIMTTCFIPCGAKMPIIGLIAGAMFGGSPLVAVSAYFIGMAAIICSGIILKKTKLFAGDPAPFVMELPAYHIPAWGNVFRATWERGWSFIKRAGSVILLATVAIWFLQGFGFENGAFGMVEAQVNSVLAAIATKVAWIFAPLGFGNWKATVASVSGLIAKENVVGTFGVLYHFGGELSENGDEIWAAVAQDYTALSAYAFMIFNLLCAPCFAAMGAIKREMNNGKWTAIAIGYMCALAYCAALVVYQLGGLITGEIGFNFFTIVAAVVLVAFIYLMVRPNKYAGNNEVKIDVTKI